MTAPSVPAGLAVMAVTGDSVAFNWTASTDNVGVAGYEIFRGSTDLGAVTATNYLDTGLNPNSSYSYTIKAFDASGNISGASSALTVQTLGGSGSLIGDFNQDGKVDIYDLSIMLKGWQQQDVPANKGDLTGDGTVNDDDVSVFVNHYGEHV